MANVSLIKAAARSRAGKGAARAERRAGRVPGIIYGDGKPPLPISIDYDDLRQRIYAGHFTEAELKAILAFYQSPLGQKMIVEEPKALDESMANAGEWGDNLSEEVIAKMRAEMKKRGHDL